MFSIEQWDLAASPSFAYFKGGSLLQAPFSTPPKDGGHERVYLGVRTCELFLAPTLLAKKKERKIRLGCISHPKGHLGKLESCCVRERYWLVPSLLIFFLKRLRNCLASSPRHWPPPCPSLSYTLRETTGIEPALSKHSVKSRHKKRDDLA